MAAEFLCCSKSRRQLFMADIVEVCRRYRVLMDEPDWDLMDDPDQIILREHNKTDNECFTVNVGELEREIRDVLWGEINL